MRGRIILWTFNEIPLNQIYSFGENPKIGYSGTSWVYVCVYVCIYIFKSIIRFSLKYHYMHSSCPLFFPVFWRMSVASVWSAGLSSFEGAWYNKKLPVYGARQSWVQMRFIYLSSIYLNLCGFQQETQPCGTSVFSLVELGSPWF